MNNDIGKKAESKIRQWLDRPIDGYSLDRLYDPMGGYYGICNPCDFICFRFSKIYYLESKATYHARFDFSMIRPNQMDGLLKKSQIPGCHGWFIVLFASYKRAFKFNAVDIKSLLDRGVKSLNISKIDEWVIPYKELRTIPSRKELLDYAGEIEDLI